MFVHNYARLDMDRWNIFVAVPFDYIFYNIACQQVLQCLAQVESVSSFQDFVATFSQFGKHMVELAHLTGDRQNVSSVAISSLSYLWSYVFAYQHIKHPSS